MDVELIRKCEDMYDKALFAIMVNKRVRMTFIASVLTSLKLKWTNEVPSGATDGLNILLNPNHWEKLPYEEQVGLLLHEAFHPAMQHFLRYKGCDNHNKANLAMDIEIDLLLMEQGIDRGVSGAIISQKYSHHKDKPWEQIYHELDDDDCRENVGAGDGSLGNDMEQDSSKSPEQQAADYAKMERIVMDAYIKAEMDPNSGAMDAIPESIKRQVYDVRNPKLPWQTLLLRHLTARTRSGYSWLKRNRRFSKAYLPSRYGKGMGKLSVYEDQSGSITDKEHALQVKEMQFIQEVAKPTEMTFNAFTTELGPTTVYRKGEIPEPNVEMTGGTKIEPVLADIRENNPEVAVIFTDGRFWSSPDYLDIQTTIFWVIVNNPSFECPIGTILHTEINNLD